MRETQDLCAANQLSSVWTILHYPACLNHMIKGLWSYDSLYVIFLSVSHTVIVIVSTRERENFLWYHIQQMNKVICQLQPPEHSPWPRI